MDQPNDLEGTPKQVFDRLHSGNQRWTNAEIELDLKRQAFTSESFVDGQDPDIVIITCSDSRVIPEFIFDAGIGDLFVIRVAGNVMSHEVVASIEFAILELDAAIVMILGHQNCGAVQSKMKVINSPPIEGSLSPSMTTLLERVKLAADERSDILDHVKANVKYQRQELLQMSTVIAEKQAKKELGVLSGVYLIDSRKVEIIY